MYVTLQERLNEILFAQSHQKFGACMCVWTEWFSRQVSQPDSDILYILIYSFISLAFHGDIHEWYVHSLHVYPDVVCPDRLWIPNVDLNQQFDENYMCYFIDPFRLMLDNIIKNKHLWLLVLFDTYFCYIPTSII